MPRKVHMDIQRLRNLTTGRLHTKVEHIYQDLEHLTGVSGWMTHQIPNASRALDPWLREVVKEDRFWDGEWDPCHVGDFELRNMDEDERKEMLERFASMPSPLEGKEVIPVIVGERKDS